MDEPPSAFELLLRSRERDRELFVAPDYRVRPQISPLDVLDGGETAGGFHVSPLAPRTAPVTPTSTASAILPFQILPAGTGSVRVVASTVANGVPQGMSASDDPPFILPVNGTVQIYAIVTFSISNGTVGGAISRYIQAGDMPDDDTANAIFSVLIGSATKTVNGVICNNLRYGPIDMTPYRKWYALPPSFGVEIGTGYY